MRVLILGGDGMLGHQVFKTLCSAYETRVTLHLPLANYDSCGLFNADNAFAGVDVRSLPRLVEVMAEFTPQAVINCIGLVKHRDNTTDAIANLEINALLPHRLAELCRIAGARLIQVSTDCVFSGRKGFYSEQDVSDAEDMYGRTKYLGEVSGPACLTLRTSIIGRELSRKRGLVEWFLNQKGSVKGFKRAIFSGFSTAEFSRIILTMLERHPQAHGLYHVSSDPIDKYTLLCLLRDRFDTQIEILPDQAMAIDRSLNSSKFRHEFNYSPPQWIDMVSDL